MGLKKIQVSVASIYPQLFDDYKEGPFESPSGHTHFGTIIKPLLGYTNLYFSGNQE